MRLLVTTGNLPEYVEGRAITIPANSVGFVLEDSEMRDIIALKDEPNVLKLVGEFELGDSREVRAKITVTDATGGASTTTVALQLVDQFDLDIGEQMLLQMLVSDVGSVNDFAATAVFQGPASKGAIKNGDGFAAIKLETDGDGAFECVLSNTVDETNWLGAWGDVGGPPVDASKFIPAVTFSA